ncbi:MAG: hypothetical protein ACT4OM_04075 [Actinomycetota bacterium]
MLTELIQGLHALILVGAVAWGGFALVKIVGPMLAPASSARERPPWRLIGLTGLLLLGLILLDQFLLGRFR